jgi:DNA-binding transcriptional MocR family regulator
MQTASSKWLPHLALAEGPLYLAICAAIARDLQQGRLRPGDRLPPQRDLAEALGLDAGTVSRAYAEARRQGLIDAEGRRGSFVREQGAAAPVAVAVQPFDTGMNLPPVPAGSTFANRSARPIGRQPYAIPACRGSA